MENPILGESAFHAKPYQQDHFIDSHDSSYSYVPDYCESSDHDTCNCPYRDYIDAACAHVEKTVNYMTNKMIENMKVRIA